MSKKSALKISALAVAIATAAPLTANAEVSGSLDIANQYLWRGLTLFSGGTVSGSLDYEHKSGAYAGIWVSSELDDTEYDIYGGYAGEAGGLSYDVGIVQYRYSAGGEARIPDFLNGESRISDANFQEAYVSLGVADFSLSGYFGFGETGAEVDARDEYYVASYSKDKFGISTGFYDFDAAVDFVHVDVSYEVIDNLTFTASTIVWEDVDDTFKKEPTFVVAYSFPF